MASKPIPLDDHVVRQCPKRLLIHNDDNEVTDVFPQAFLLRPKETYLSSVWLEFFAGDLNSRLAAVKAALEAAGREVKKSNALLRLHVREAIEAGNKRSVRIRILHEPKKNNKAYAAIRGIPTEDADLLELLRLPLVTKIHPVRHL